ncbi:MAPK/MAK/MRK overlapping kinase-like [Anopheles bellator]|uniref:MAPK/MAK/MRK overlapping kinase-like n=1 Tax=Anopheles bellator TaxID=139047 RepID=UPI002647C406|nr:MAPK/MAK/MRK overlapping kinase-like [Anopheles bellator]
MSRPKLRDYKVLEKIGEGAFSDVYRVRDRVLGTYFAAKKLREECDNIDDPLLCSEVNLIKQVPSHPNLLTILDVMHYGNRLTLIMELMDMSLHDYIQTRKRALSENRARRFIFQIISGLDHLHRHGIFHRDIKPENILIKLARGVEKKELVQLGDFGTICRIDEQLPHTPYIATRWYRAPECLLTMGYYGPKMDVWAVGCCFYEMITRQPLFPGGNELHMLDLIHGLLGTPSKSLLEKFKHLNIGKLEFRKHCPEDFRLLLPLLSAYGVDVLKKTLAYHPDQRISAARLIKHVYFEDVM